MILISIKEPYLVCDGLLIRAYLTTDRNKLAAWVVKKDDGYYYYKLFLTGNVRLEGPFQAIDAVILACEIMC